MVYLSSVIAEMMIAPILIGSQQKIPIPPVNMLIMVATTVQPKKQNSQSKPAVVFPAYNHPKPRKPIKPGKTSMIMANA